MATDFDKKLGMRIRQIRERVGFSQDDLAKRLGLSRVTVSQIESGHRKVNAGEMATLARLFDVTADILLDLEKDIVVILDKSRKSREEIKRPALRINVPQKNIDKFKEVLLYVLKQVGSKPNIGESVIYKLLYFIDFDYYEKYEEQMIGASYIKNHYGPTPVEFAKIVQQMEGKDLVKVEKKFFDFRQKKYLPLREPDLSKLNARELATIDDILKKLSDKTAKDISEYSHKDVPWLTTENGKVIDYESVFYRTPAYSVRSYDDEDIQ
jgi:transcriptional regulator with XRE-family HTH domain